MYDIYTYTWLVYMVNVGKYTIHGWYGKHMLQLGWFNHRLETISTPRKAASKSTRCAPQRSREVEHPYADSYNVNLAAGRVRGSRYFFPTIFGTGQILIASTQNDGLVRETSQNALNSDLFRNIVTCPDSSKIWPVWRQPSNFQGNHFTLPS